MDSIANFSQPNTFHYCQLGNLLYSHISKEAVRRILCIIMCIEQSQLLPPMQHQKNEDNERYIYVVWYILYIFCVCLPIFPISSTSLLHLIKMASPTNYLLVIISFVFWCWHWNMFGSRKFECLADLLRSHRCSKN